MDGFRVFGGLFRTENRRFPSSGSKWNLIGVRFGIGPKRRHQEKKQTKPQQRSSSSTFTQALVTQQRFGKGRQRLHTHRQLVVFFVLDQMCHGQSDEFHPKNELVGLFGGNRNIGRGGEHERGGRPDHFDGLVFLVVVGVFPDLFCNEITTEKKLWRALLAHVET